ncbi:hypothetical protein EHP00_1487 [Ecytonucleospora hepatopenaei]|uniref:Ricin B lectin domain-containing protein n=1 Tax=Ecytonucleospora hepatopenaei TaxID=646526 RepID=A0A1W0E8P6_9MICR|nr:hypothetical protein EHP00_1487 [Ecytonucleospora hepatopenaei]
MFINVFLNAVRTAQYPIYNFGELLVNSTLHDQYTLVRLGDEVYMAPETTVFNNESYNTLPLEVIKGKNVEFENQVFINLAGKYLCEYDSQASNTYKVGACLDPSKSQWLVYPNQNRTLFVFKNKKSGNCLSVDKKDEKINRFLLRSVKCSTYDKSQLFSFTRVTSKNKGVIEPIDNKEQILH